MTNWKLFYKDLTIDSLYEELEDVKDLINRKNNLLMANIGNPHELSKIFIRIGNLYEQLATINDLIEEKEKG